MGAATPTAMEALTATTAPPSMDRSESGLALVAATIGAVILVADILEVGILEVATAADMVVAVIDPAMRSPGLSRGKFRCLC